MSAMATKPPTPEMPPLGPGERLLTTRTVAREAGVEACAVQKWCRLGLLGGYVRRTAGGHYRIHPCVVAMLRRGQSPFQKAPDVDAPSLGAAAQPR